MADFSVVKIDEMETTFGGGLRKARAELGVTSVGMSILTLPAGYDRYPDHDDTHDKQCRGAMLECRSKARHWRSLPECYFTPGAQHAVKD